MLAEDVKAQDRPIIFIGDGFGIHIVSEVC